MIYLDSAATTLDKPPSVARAAAAAIGTLASPGRGGHSAAMRAAERAYDCRARAARLFRVSDPERVVFTSSATHGLNIAINSVVSPRGRVLISGFEHNAVVRPLHAMDVSLRTASSPLFDAQAAAEAFDEGLRQGADAVVCTHVSNVFGFILPVEEIAGMCRERGVPLIIDASQSAGCIPLDAEALGADFIAMPGHKGLYGPQGTGLLICGAEPRPYIYGGTGSGSLSRDMPRFLPDMLEAGTHNMPGIAGLDEGLRFVLERGTQRILSHERSLIARAHARLSSLPGLRLYAPEPPGAGCGVMSFTASGLDPEAISAELSRRGIAVRAGLHCAPLAHESAGTLPDGTARISVSAFNTARDIDALYSALSAILR